MSQIKNIEKIPEEVRELTEIGLGEALKKGSLGKMKINFIQIENSLSGGKTGAVVFVARYGFSSSDELPITKTKKKGKKKTEYQTNASIETTFVRVLKIAPKEICESENEGYVKTRETLLDIFSQVEYYTEDEFVHEKNDYGILLYQDVGTVAASDLKGIAKYFTNKILQEDNEHKPEAKDDSEKFSRELSLLMQKEVFLGIKKGLYGTVKRRDINITEQYGKKLTSEKVKQGLAELQKIDESIPDHATILNYFNINATYHEVNYVHGDLNPENVLVWENERGFLSCKLIDFGEVIPKKKDNFTPLFWDYSRLLGEMILNFVEEMMNQPNVGDGRDRPLHLVDSILNDFWSVVEAFFKNDPSKLENANPKIEYISRIYLSTLFDFINEAKSGLKDLRRAEVMQDYFYCQILFFLFFAKFQKENPYKRLFGVKFALKLYEYANSGDAGLQSLIQSLEKLYFDFSSTRAKNKKPQIGPAVGARSPFMGLSYFQEKDKEFFFGREKFTEELLNAIEEKPIVALAGASGSGKSSVVHAGVIPKLREQGYLIYKFRPGANPYQAAMKGLIGGRPQPNFIEGEKSGSNNAPLLKEEGQPIDGSDLKELIGSILRSNPNNRLFLLGDQFEELFTLCTDTRQREDLGQALIDCAKEFKDSFRFFITIRSDFWTKLIEDASFASVVGDSGSNKHLGAYKFLNPMNVDELRSTIEKPLAVSKLFIQDGLTDLILTSISKEPGSLPLLEFCLHELWKDQVDYTLTYNTYKKIGEVKGALATYAEQVYSSLSEDEKEQLKKIMLQLVQPGQGTEDTRRIALVEDVVGDLGVDRPHPDSSDSEKSGSNKTPLPKGEGWRSRGDGDSKLAFINTLADKRLIVTGVNETGKQTFEVVHEALIREWERLKEWINADREFRVWQEKLRYAEKQWQEGEKEEGLLLHGSNIATAEDWFAKRKVDLGKKEIEYIETSIKERDRIQREKEEAKERELQKELAAEKKAKKTQRMITIGSAMAAIVAMGLSWLAYGKMKDSEANEDKSQALVLNSYYKERVNFNESYFEILQLAIKNENLSEKYHATKKAIWATLYDFTYQPLKKEIYAEIDKYPLAKMGYKKTLSGHSSPVNSVSFSPDGKTLVSGSNDTNIKLWDANTGKELKTLSGHSSGVSSVSFSPDGKTLVSGSHDNSIKLWDVNTGKELKTLSGHSSPVNSVSFSPDGKTLVSGSNDTNIKLWDANTGKELKTLSGHSSGVSSVSFSPDGKTLVSGSYDTNIKLWDANTGKELKTLSGHSNWVNSVSFSPDGKTLVSGSYDNNIKLWDVNTGKEIKTLSGRSSNVSSVSFSPDGKTLVSGSYENNITLWDVETGKEIKTLSSHNASVDSVSYSPDGRSIASGSWDNKIKIWDVETGKEIKTLSGHNAGVNSVSYSPDGRSIASGSWDNKIKIWDVETGKEIKTLSGHSSTIYSVSYSPDGELIASGSWDTNIKIWDVETGKEIKTLSGHGSGVSRVSYSPDGKSIVSGSYDAKIKIWDVETGKEIKTFSGHSSRVNSVSYSPDGKSIVSGSYDNNIKLWEANTGKELKTLSGHSSGVSSVSFSPDGKTLVSGSHDNSIKLWDVNTGKELKTLSGHSSPVNSVSFSPDGKTLVSGSYDNNIKLWDVNTGKELKTLSGHSSGVSSVSFSPDGKTLVSGSYDNNIKLWDVNTGKELKTLSGHSSYVSSVSFSPDSKTLVSGSDDKNIRIWNLAISDLLPLACDDLKIQMEHWVSLKERSPFPVNDTKETQKICEGIIARKHKEIQLVKEYEYLTEARKYIAESRKDYIKEEDKKKNLESAIQNLKEALKLKPDFSPAQSELIDLYFNSEKYDLALEYFPNKEYFYLNRARKTEDSEKKITDYLEAIKINPNLEPAKTELAQLYFNTGKEQEAFVMEKQKEYLYLNRGRDYLQKIKNNNDKKENANETEKKNFEDSNIALKEKAMADLLEAFKINPKIQPVRAELAELSIQKGKEFYEKKEFASAIPEFTKAIEMQPGRAIFYDYRGDAYYYENKEIAKAIGDYETYLELEKSDHEHMNKEAIKFLNPEEGRVISPRELELAVEYSKKSLELSPENPSYLNTLAEIYFKLGDKSNAKKYNDQAKKIAEEKKDAELLKGILEREGKF